MAAAKVRGGIKTTAFAAAVLGRTAGAVFDGNHCVSNYYSFTGGTFRDGQSAVGVRLFDALSINGQSTGFGGGFTLTSAVPEPATLGLMLLALPWLG